MKEQTLYAFWNYDVCPYMIGGEITEFVSGGKVHVKGYGTMRFKPIAILADDDGKNALATLIKLRYISSQAIKTLKMKFKNEARLNIGLKEE